LSKSRKILVWGGAGAVLLACLAVGFLLALPGLVDMDAIGRNALATLHARYDLDFREIKVSLLPYPHAVVRGVGMKVPEVLDASADSIAVYPRILPLLAGKFHPAEVRLVNPKVALKLPGHSAPHSAETAHRAKESADKSLTARFSSMKERIVQLEGALSAALPGIVIDLRGGSLEIYSGNERSFRFDEIVSRATVLPEGIDLRLSIGKSGIWNSCSFSGRVDPHDWKGSGELSIAGCASRELVSFLTGPEGHRIGDSSIDLTVKLASIGLKEVRADFTAAVPRFVIEEGRDGEKKIVLQNGSLAGSVSLDPERMDIGISSCRFGYPKLSLNGRFKKNLSDESAALDIYCRDVEAESVRDVMLSLLGKSPTVQRVFNIVRGGEVPAISYIARAPGASELDKLENFKLEGSLKHGLIFAPKAELLVSNVYGDVIIEEGILVGTGLSGKSGGTTTSGGTLKIGLAKGETPFHLDLPLKADLTDLPPVLDRTVKDEDFRRELELITDLKGAASGRLILGDTTEHVKVWVETGPFRISGTYGRFADPLDIEGAYFFLDGPKIQLKSVSGKSGGMKLSKVDFAYEFGGEKLMILNSSAPAILPLPVIEPLIRARDDWKNLFASGPLKGTIIFDTFNFKGPTGDRSKWVFDGAGAFDDVTVQTRYFTGPMNIKSGAFDASRETLNFKQLNVSLADSSLNCSGTVNGFFDTTRSAQLSASGHLGPSGNKDIAALADLPATIRGISGLTLDQSRFSWEKGVKTAFEGEMLVASGPKVGIKIVQTPEEVSIEELVVQDVDSNAVISLKLRPKVFDIGFSGSLSNRTADKLLSENKILSGPIEGKFKALLYIDEPRRSTAEGQIKISGFQLPVGFKVPAKIENAMLEAKDNRIDIKSAMLSWNESRLSLGGTVTIVDSAYLVDMSAFADTLDLEAILDGRKDEPEGAEVKDSKKGWDAPITGTIRVRSERLVYGKLTWNPAIADVVLSPGHLDVKIDQANLCGISTPGRVNIAPEGTSMALNPEAKDQELEPALACFFNKKHLVTGKYSLKSKLASTINGNKKKLMEGLEGDIDILATKGRVYRFEHFAKIMSLLSITEIYRGQLPDLMTDGCSFDTLRIKGKIHDGKLTLTESVLDGPSMKMVFRGEVDIAKKKMDVVALVSPIRTMDRLIGAVPLVKKIFDGVIVVPVRLTGELSDPTVIPLSPTAVGEELFGFMKKTFQLPITLLQPLAEGAGQAVGSPRK